MVAVPAGCFEMGCGPWTNNCFNNEKPVHRVCLKAFNIGKYEVTQAQWQALMGYNPSFFTGNSQRPVEKVNWDDAQEYIRRLNKVSGKNYRLPTEAQWEYAAPKSMPVVKIWIHWDGTIRIANRRRTRWGQRCPMA
jgi:formylglycine-generating enzyme required for sulfatase activity